MYKYLAVQLIVFVFPGSDGSSEAKRSGKDGASEHYVKRARESPV